MVALLRAICLAGLLTGSTQAKQASAATQQFSKDGLTFSYPTGWSLRDDSTSEVQSVLLVRDEFSRMMIFSPRAAGGSPAEVAAAIQSFVEPSIADVVRVIEARGASVERTPTSTEMAGSQAEGVRLRFTLDGTPRLFEIYWRELGGRVISANFLTSEREAADVRAAWDVVRNSLTLSQVQTSLQAPCAAGMTQEQMFEVYRQGLRQKAAGRVDEALVSLECAIKEMEQVLAQSEHQGALALPYNELGQLYYEKGDYGKAEAAYRRALGLSEKFLPLGDNTLAISLSNLAAVFEARGQFAEAEPLMKRALQIFESEKPPDPQLITTALNNLGMVHYAQGKLTEAEPLYRRAVEMIESLPAGEREGLDEVYAQLLDNLGQLYDERGDYQSAEPLYKRAIAIADPSAGPKHPRLAFFLNDLGLLYYRVGKYEAAKPLYERSLELKIKIYGLYHREVATTLNNLGMLLRAYESYDNALTADLTALEIRERTLPPGHPDIALSLNNIGLRYRDKGDYVSAEAYTKRALSIYEQTLGPNSSYVALALMNLGVVYDAKGETALALEHKARGLEVRETNIALLMTAGSESQKLSYLSLLTGEVDGTVSLDVRLRGKEPRATRLALTTVLRRKGRVLDALSDTFGPLRRSLPPEVAPLLNDLASVRARLATLVFRGAGQADPQEYRAEVNRLEARERQLEADISARSDRYRMQSQRVTVEAVQRAIPADAALVEFVLYRPFKARGKAFDSFDEPHYVAYVLRRAGDPVSIPLGPAAKLDGMITQLRAKLRSPGHGGKELAQSVNREFMAPLTAALGGLRHVFISTDGSLHFLPFAALVDEGGQYLLETYTFTYLTSGRDLLRLQTAPVAGRPPVAVAAPRFDGADGPPQVSQGGGASTRGADEAADFSNLKFDPLPDSVREAAVLKKYLPTTVTLSDVKATEAALRELKGPLVLHIATHGFFLPDRAAGTPRQLTFSPGAGNLLQAPTLVAGGNPLLRSGLWLTGANRRAGGGVDDGVLTALETAGLNLDGTELVVLSACETGVGEVQNGEGVYGLRRSLFTAGARSAVVSLWKVNADATTDIATKYYDHLLRRREGRSSALREAQLEMLRNRGTAQDYSSPYFWAGFIPLGDWKALNHRAP